MVQEAADALIGLNELKLGSLSTFVNAYLWVVRADHFDPFRSPACAQLGLNTHAIASRGVHCFDELRLRDGNGNLDRHACVISKNGVEGTVLCVGPAKSFHAFHILLSGECVC